MLADLNHQGVSLCQLPMAAVMSNALGIKWTREPGDRIIVANAMANSDAPLITSDRRIHEAIRTRSGDGWGLVVMAGPEGPAAA